MNTSTHSERPQSEAEVIVAMLNEVFDTAAPQLSIDIARMIEAIEADPDNDELWEQAQQFLVGYD